MGDDFNKGLIDDSGVYDTGKERQTKIFVAVCRILTVILAILGILALIKGN